jgi:iron complex outermembrane receptor protein
MGAVASMMLLSATNAFAQNTSVTPPVSDVAPAVEAEAERVIVTGSNIPTAEEVGPHPVDTYGREDIARLGVRTPTDLVQMLPAATGASINENGANNGDGRTEVNLRGILAKETLVLQDGRRLAPVGFAGDTVDLNTFPLGLIDHIDVLKDGASAIYGADAVAGVFNVHLIHRFRGLELYASYGNTNLGFANDMAEERAYILAGTGDDKTDIVVYSEFYDHAAIFSRDVDISHDADYTQWGGQDYRNVNFAGGIRITKNYFSPTGGYVYQPRLNAGARTPTPHAFPNVQTDPQYVPRKSLPPEQQLYNFADLTPLLPAADRAFFYGSVTRDLCDKYLRVFADFKYAHTSWNSGLAPIPFASDIFADAAHPSGISSSGISVPLQNPFNPFTVADYTSTGGTQFTTRVSYRALETGLRSFKIGTDNYEVTGGLKGNLGEFGDYFKTWDWESGARFNEDHRIERVSGIANNSALRAALLDTNPKTAFNPFGLNQNSQAVLNRIFVSTTHFGTTFLETEDFKLNGDLFSVPAGPVSFATGGEHRREHTNDRPDAITASGDLSGATNFAPTQGSRDVWSTYWEIRLPVTSSAWTLPGFHSLELDYQERYENFSDFGSTERPKFSVRWQPIDSALTIRGAYSEAYHAPTLGNLFSGKTQILVNGSGLDPRSFVTGEVEIDFSGNPNLQPETAYEWTYGAVLTPGKWWSLLEGLTVQADFYHLDLRAVTVQPDPLFVAQHEDQFPGLVTRGPSTDPVSDPFGPIIRVLIPYLNLGQFIEEGWDYEAVYVFQTNRLGRGDWGTFTTTLNATYLADADLTAFPGGTAQEVSGKFGGGFLGASAGGSFTHNRGYASLFYDGAPGSWLAGLDTGVTVPYVGQYWDNRLGTFYSHKHRPSNNPFAFVGFRDRKVREWITLNWILNYTFRFSAPASATEVAGLNKEGNKNTVTDGKEKNVTVVSTAEYNPCGWRAWLNSTTITLGMNNVFDEQPPFVAGAFENGYDEATANPKGRYWYVAVKKRF